jgi:glycosyltransferase involved in cell wall biosynthesis
MISVCIPIYNFDVRVLIKNLHQQLTEAALAFEIILMDDASTEYEIIEYNKTLSKLAHCQYIQLPENIGRAAIRNKLGETAVFPNLLFMDCDAKAPTDFIRKYIVELANDTAIVVGGRVYTPTPPKDKSQYLRWFFGRKRESFSARQRAAHPYQSFMTCNFLVKKKSYTKFLSMSVFAITAMRIRSLVFNSPNRKYLSYI